MKTLSTAFITIVVAILLLIIATPLIIATTLQALANEDQQNCGAVFAAAIFTPDQVIAAYAPANPPGDPVKISGEMTGASLSLGPSIIEFFDANITIKILGEDASIKDPKWAPLASLKPNSAGANTDPEGPPPPSTTTTATPIDPNTPTTTFNPTASSTTPQLNTTTIKAPPTPPPVTLDNILATIRFRESTGNYTAEADKGTASGAYQFTDETWNNFRGYKRAKDAPPNVQDEKAALQVQGILTKHGLAGVPIGWYYPAALSDLTYWMDRIPRADYGNTLTIREYQTAWLETYARIAGGLPADINSGGSCTPPAGEANGTGDIVTITSKCGAKVSVDNTISTNLEAMLNKACDASIAVTGSGWRSPESQIALRRAHCGPTEYDIYQKPSDQCQPPTATPGNSMHEKGLAIDFAQNGNALTRASTAFRWLAINARSYGFYNLASEPWHWSTNGR
jgi:hypothetical protein